MGRLFESLDSRVLKDESRQARARQAGVPCTTVLSGAILQRQGGRSNLAFEQVGSVGQAMGFVLLLHAQNPGYSSSWAAFCVDGAKLLAWALMHERGQLGVHAPYLQDRSDWSAAPAGLTCAVHLGAGCIACSHGSVQLSQQNRAA